LAIWPVLPVGTGIVQESRPLINLTRKYGTTSVIDLTRALGHLPIQFTKESPDVVMGNCWTGLYAPQGAAFIGIAEPLLTSFTPPIIGEGNIAEASWTHVKPSVQSGTIAAGDINMVSIAGLGAGLMFFKGNSLAACMAHEQELLTELMSQLRGIPRCKIVGPPDEKRSLLVSFSIEGMDAHDIGMYLNELHHTIVRTGQLCSQPFLADLGEPNVVQVSVAPFIEEADVEKFANNLKEIVKEMG
jgi:cysteine sulfinate desulfinase